MSNNSLIVCPKCSNIPSITIQNSQLGSIKVKCHCGFNEYCSSQQFQNNFRKQKNAFIKIYCSKHIDKEYEYYCQTCKEDICEICIQNHSNHLVKEHYTLNPKMLRKKIKKGYDFFNKDVLQIINKFIKELQSKINLIQTHYQKSKERNETLLSLLSTLLDNYECFPNRFQIYQNVIANSNFKLKMKNTDDCNRFLNYLDNFTILKHSNSINYNLEKLKTINENYFKTMFILKDGNVCLCNSDIKCKLSIYNSNDFSLIMKCNFPNKINKIIEYDTYKFIVYTGENTFEFCKIIDKKVINEKTIRNIQIDNIIEISQNKFASSIDNSIIIRNTKSPFNTIATLSIDKEKHNINIISMLYIKENDKLVSNSSDYLIRVWDMTVYQCVTVFALSKVDQTSHMIQIDNNKVLISYETVGKISVLNLSKNTIEEQIENTLLYSVHCMTKFDNDTIIMGSSYSTSKEISINLDDYDDLDLFPREDSTETIYSYYLECFNLENSSITYLKSSESENYYYKQILKINNNTIITYSSNGIEIWKFIKT